MAIAAKFDALSASDHSAQLRKAVVAATIGTTIEWYDFFIYGTAAGLIFGGSNDLSALSSASKTILRWSVSETR